jgi:hypothetical protein
MKEFTVQLTDGVLVCNNFNEKLEFLISQHGLMNADFKSKILECAEALLTEHVIEHKTRLVAFQERQSAETYSQQVSTRLAQALSGKR